MVAERAAIDIGTTHDGDWTEKQITDAMATSNSYLPKIEAWMAKAAKDRLAAITGPTWSNYPMAGRSPTRCPAATTWARQCGLGRMAPDMQGKGRK